MVDISVVVPVYGCRDSLRALHERVSAALRALSPSYEIVLVDDCDRQGSWEVAAQNSSKSRRGSSPARARPGTAPPSVVIAVVTLSFLLTPGEAHRAASTTRATIQDRCTGHFRLTRRPGRQLTTVWVLRW